MRWRWNGILALLWLAMALPAAAGTGRVLKVLPELLDKGGKTSLYPSLYERDAYQAMLRQHPALVSGIRFYVQWRTKAPIWERLRIRLEMRGGAQGNLASQLSLEKPVPTRSGLLGQWTAITLDGDPYKKFGSVSAWRVTLWEGGKLLGEQKSFLW